MLGHYKGSLLFTAVCLMLAAWLGFATTGSVAGMLGVLWIVLVLGVLEVSLSFDNAIVNATVLRGMAPVWRRRFLVWGIPIAVFGTRVLFPLAVVSVAGHVGPLEAVRVAVSAPATYERIVTGAHVGISGFGGAFLAMVGLSFFLDEDKEVHWIGLVERPWSRLARVPALGTGLVLLALYGASRMLAAGDAMTLLVSGIFGLVSFIAVDAIGKLIGGEAAGAGAASGAATAGLGAFLYLEVLDASFSLDGVIGAFALSNNLFVIALGLGIGAMFVRSLTLVLVDRGTLAHLRYLEHGAFYAILALAAIMLVSTWAEVPETVTGLIGAGIIGLSFWSSMRARGEGGAGPA